VQKTSIVPFFNPFWIYGQHHIHKKFSFVEQDTDQIKLYNILRTDLKLSDDKAADFVSAIRKTAERELDARIQTLATKNDIRELSLATKMTYGSFHPLQKMTYGSFHSQQKMI
jgi:TRAP-type uncharacterized transport system substrate-binding protein